MFKEEYMRLALKEAAIAYDEGEVPVGALIELEGSIIGIGRNRRVYSGLATSHAEIMAIEMACSKIKDFRLTGATLYTTLEPCMMCTGAILEARIKRVIIGARDHKRGSISSVNKVGEIKGYNPPIFEFGVLEEECATLLSKFFSLIRLG